MAFASLFTLLDDIASVLDDVALMSKMAAKKTAGVVGDDLALNANQVTGVQADRELPIVWAVTKGSLVNKIILIPLAMVLSIFAPAWITPLLMIGGGYLCFEGVEKLLHKMLHRAETTTIEVLPDMIDDEKNKIKGAIRTDFILSAEIIIIALGTIPADASNLTKVLALIAVGIGITFVVYGIVAAIVKADDLGLHLAKQPEAGKQVLGRAILAFMPWFMRGLGVVGTLAMFLVGGGIFMHHIPALQHIQWGSQIVEMLATLATGFVIGSLACSIILPLMKLLNKVH